MRTALFLLIVAGILPPVQAQPALQFTAGEAKALARKERGDFVGAAEELHQAITASDLGDAGARALVECLAVQAFGMARATGVWAPLRTTLQATAARARDYVGLREALTLLDLEAALETGDQAGLGLAPSKLGLLTAWWVVGPFDNERGGGFARALAPETAIDLDATYDGKKRPVRWRQLPVAAPPLGVIDCNALFRPDDQVLCYALTVVHSNAEQTVALRVGSDEALKVFHHGVEVLARDVRRTFAHDQDAVALKLRAGANLLLLKVCEQQGEFAFAARLSRLDGGPLDGVRLTCTEHELRAAAGTWNDGNTLRPAAAEEPDLFAQTFYARALAQADASAPSAGVDAFRLATLLAHRYPDDPNERRDHKLAQQAVAALPDATAARMLLAFTRRRPVLHEAEKEESARRFDYEAILAKEPDHPRALYELAVMDLDSIGAAEAAETRLRAALSTTPAFALARVELARALRLRKLDALADRELELAAQAPAGRAPQIQGQLADLRRRQGKVGAAIAALQQARAADARNANRVTALADALLRNGQRGDAGLVLHGAEASLPFERAPRLKMARLQRAERKLDDAIATLGRWLTICPEDDEALVELARVHGIAGRAEQHKELLRTAIDLNKNLNKERRYLDFLEAKERPFYEAWRIDGADVVKADKGPPADAQAKNDPVHVLLDQTVVRAYRNGTSSEYHHQVVRVLNDEGAQQMARHFVPHYFGEQRARLLGARVFKKDGEVVRPKLREYYVELPSLQPGDVVDLEERIDDLAPSFFGDYFGLVHYFTRGNPVARSELVAVLDAGRKYEVQPRNGAPAPQRRDLEDGTQVLHFVAHDLARTDYEEFQPNWQEMTPLVRITTYADWDGFASWWWNLIRKQSEVTPAMQDKVRELTAGKTSDLAKLDALYRFVTTDVRYTAWEFGVHGYKPYSTPAIFERRHGDCKDKSLLLNALLGEVGIAAYPVLIQADDPRSHDDLSLAMVQHFNHCISYVPAQRDLPEMFLDGTATYHPIDTLPAMDHGARVLVVRDGKADLRDVPWADPAHNVDREEFVVDVAPTGDAELTLTHRPQRNHAVDVRAELGNEPGKRKEKLEKKLAETLGKVKVEEVKTSDLLDLGQPVEVVVDLTVQDFAARQGDGLVLKGVLDPPDLSALTSKPERTFALLRGTPESTSHVLRYKLPPGFAPAALPEPTQAQTRFGTFRLVWTQGEGELRIERELSFTMNRIEPAEYPLFREFITAVQRADSQVVVVKPKGGSK